MRNRHCRNRANNPSSCQAYSIDMSRYSGTLFRSDRVHNVHFRSNTKFIEYSPAAASLTFTRRKFWSTSFTDATNTMMSKSKQKCAERLRRREDHRAYLWSSSCAKFSRSSTLLRKKKTQSQLQSRSLESFDRFRPRMCNSSLPKKAWMEALNVKQEKNQSRRKATMELQIASVT